MRTRSAHLGMAAAILASATIAACGASVETSANAGASASGSGGAAAASGSTTAVVSSSVGQGGASMLCGGELGSQCGPMQFCAYDPPGTCGNADGLGTCKPNPGNCTDDCPGVCGCDGQFYCNACSANAAGVDVSDNGGCAVDAGAAAIYSAQDLFTNVPRFAIFKADPARDLCFRLIVEASSGGPQLGIITPGSWSVGMAEVTDHASDCALPNGGFPPPPVGASVKATSGTGKIDFPPSGPTCFVTIHASLSFPKGAPWVPAIEPLDADALKVGGACSP